MGYFDDATIAALRKGSNVGYFLRVASAPALHMWFGTGNIPIGFEDDTPGQVYYGGGKLTNIPSLSILLNGRAERVEFQLNGVDATFLADFDADAPPVKGAEVHVGLAALDERFQPISPYIKAVWRGIADKRRIGRLPQTDPKAPAMGQIALSVGAGDIGRSRPQRVTWTPEQQREQYPTDALCDRVSRYTHSFVVPWPHFRSGD